MDQPIDQIDRIRAFNRQWTRTIGLLTRSYLGSGLGLAEVRLLHDLDADTPIRARDLAKTLGLDEAQVSRSLAGFERIGWLTRIPGPDRRARLITLTEEGRALVQGLKDRSRAALVGMLEAMSPPARAALTEGLDQARQALEPQDILLTDLRPGDAGWVIAAHAEAYARDEGYDSRFEALVARILSDHLTTPDPRAKGWIARAASRRLGSIFVMPEDATTVRLRLFLLQPEARGTGLAQRMLDEALSFARDKGFTRMTLWTHESHQAAGRIYARNGFTLTASTPAHAFGQEVVDQTWDRSL